MIEPGNNKLSISNQCRLLDVNRSTFYYQPKPVKPEDQKLMRLIDEQYMKTPTSATRSMRNHLDRLCDKVNRKKVQRLMGIEAIYPKPKTSRPHPQHNVYPYLLRNMTTERPNQVWAADITYVPMNHGSMYLVAVMDWCIRKVLSFRVSNTLDAVFCVETLCEALERYGPPHVFSTDQWAQFTSKLFTDTLKSAGVTISMHGRPRAIDNIFAERLLWTVKYHYLYLHAFDSGAELCIGLMHCFMFYNSQRPLHGLDDMMPDVFYFDCSSIAEAAR